MSSNKLYQFINVQQNYIYQRILLGLEYYFKEVIYLSINDYFINIWINK